MKKIHTDNRGMSLLELLVAILILGVLIAPLLNSFLISASSARKTRALDAATNAASNIVENIKAEQLDAVLARIPGNLYGAQAAFDSSTIEADGKYVINLSDFHYGSNTYSGTLTLDAESYNTSINSTSVVKYSFSGIRCGAEMSNIDTTAAEMLTSQVNLTAYDIYQSMIESGIIDPDAPEDPEAPPAPGTLSVSDVLNSMHRKLTLTVETLNDDQIVITAKSHYSYDNGIYGINEFDMPDQKFYGPYDKAIYFFYYPMYTGTDEIIIENNPTGENLEFTFFLVKQRPLQVAQIMAAGGDVDIWLKARDDVFITNARTKPFLTLSQNFQGPQAALCSNIGVRLNKTTGSDIVDLRYREVLDGSAWANSKSLGHELVELMQPDRLYSLSVELTSNSSRDKTTVKIDTTKLDFPAE